MSTDPVEFQAMAKSLLASGTFADFTVICGEKYYEIHRALLMCHSSYFKTCFLSKFKEAEEGVIDLKKDLPEAVEIMIKYCYHFDYDLTYDEMSGKSTLLTHSTVYAIADKYQIPDLKALARVKFTAGMKKGDGGPSDAVPHVFESTPETDFGLRDVCFLGYANCVQREKETWENVEEDGNIPLLIQMCKISSAAFPDLAAEVSVFGLFSQAGLLRPKKDVDPLEKGSVALTKNLFAYLGMQTDKTREKKLRALLDVVGHTGW